MKKADQKIINENPGLTPQQLLTKGLSQEGYLSMLEASNTQAAKVLTANPIPNIPIVGKVIQPIISNIGLPAKSQKVRIAPIGGGVGSIMDRTRAESMMRRSPNTYVIKPAL